MLLLLLLLPFTFPPETRSERQDATTHMGRDKEGQAAVGQAGALLRKGGGWHRLARRAVQGWAGRAGATHARISKPSRRRVSARLCQAASHGLGRNMSAGTHFSTQAQTGARAQQAAAAGPLSLSACLGGAGLGWPQTRPRPSKEEGRRAGQSAAQGTRQTKSSSIGNAAPRPHTRGVGWLVGGAVRCVGSARRVPGGAGWGVGVAREKVFCAMQTLCSCDGWPADHNTLGWRASDCRPFFLFFCRDHLLASRPIERPDLAAVCALQPRGDLASSSAAKPPTPHLAPYAA